MSTPAVLDRRAAEHIEVGGARLPAHFGDVAAEYGAARGGVALAHRADRALFRVAGDDRGKFLHGLLTSDVAALQPGAGCRALFLDNKGHVRGVLDLWAGEQAIVVGCEPAFIDEVLPDLTRYILAAAVEVVDLRPHKTVLAVLGPEADELLRRAGAAVPPPQAYAHGAAQLGGTAVWLARTPDLAGAGVEVHAPTGEFEAVWNALEAAAGETPVCVGWTVAQALRVEAGLPRMGREISGEEFPQELRLDSAIDYEKGCYLGQETVARIHYRGRVNRLLSGVRSAAPLPRGAELVSSGRQVGRVCSAALSPALGSIGLALVRREESEAGASVEVVVDGETVTEARVVSLPISG